MTQSAVFTGLTDSVSGGAITVVGAIPDVTSDLHFVWVTDGALEGQWFAVTSGTATTVTVAEDLAAAGLVSSDSFRVLPFWTLDTLLPLGGGIPTSSSPSSVQGSIFLNNLSASGINLAPSNEYVYFDDGAGGVPNGWYDINNPGAGVLGDTPITPASYFTIRNNTGSLFTVTFTGSVPFAAISNEIVSLASQRQDNQVPNLFPTGMTLGLAGFIDSNAIRSTSNPSDVNKDSLFVYDVAPTSQNPAPAIEFVHIDDGEGGVPNGWYNINNPGAGIQDSYVINPGAALVIRRGADSDAVYTWKAPLPYSIN
jgi:uncharacterized protein (TIGR02597 family)